MRFKEKKTYVNTTYYKLLLLFRNCETSKVILNFVDFKSMTKNIFRQTATNFQIAQKPKEVNFWSADTPQLHFSL